MLAPFIVVLNRASYGLVRLTGTDPDGEPETGTPAEIKRIIADSRSGGAIDVGEADMLTGVFHLHEQEARQVMTPIPAVVTVDLSETVRDALRRCVRQRALPAGGDRGRQPGPGQAGSCTSTSWSS